jgi:hypothetical protein
MEAGNLHIFINFVNSDELDHVFANFPEKDQIVQVSEPPLVPCPSYNEDWAMHDYSVFPPKLLSTPVKHVDDCEEGHPHEVWRSSNAGNEKAFRHMYGDDHRPPCNGRCLTWRLENGE